MRTEPRAFAPVPTILFLFAIVGFATIGTIGVGLLYAIGVLWYHGAPWQSIIGIFSATGHVIAATSDGTPITQLPEPLVRQARLFQSTLARPTTMFIIQGLSDIVLSFFILWRLPKVAQRSLAELGVRRPTFSDLRVGALGLLAAYPATLFVQLMAQAITHIQAQQDTIGLLLHMSGKDAIYAAIAAVIIAPITEELAFRAVLMNALSTYLPRFTAILTTGVLFGMAHLQWTMVPELAAAGLVFGLVYDRTGCLWSNIMTHSLFNGVAFILIFVFHQTS